MNSYAEELCESEHVCNYTKLLHVLLDAKCEKVRLK